MNHPPLLGRCRLMIGVLGLSLVVLLHEAGAETAGPGVPTGGELRAATGEAAQRTDLATAVGLPVNGSDGVVIPLKGLAPGSYEVGLIVNSGLNLNSPFGEAGGFMLGVSAEGEKPKVEVCRTAAPTDPAIKPWRKPEDQGKEWAAWRGLVLGQSPVAFKSGDRLSVRYVGSGSSMIYGVWLRKHDRPQDMVGLKVTVDAIDNAFTPANPPKFDIKVSNTGSAAFNGLLRIDLFDLYLNQTTTDFVPMQVAGSHALVYQPKLPNGVFRLTFRAAADKELSSAAHHSDSVVVANAPAVLARELPDHWPLGAHHYNPSPILKGPMPGFKWYRTFIGWDALNPEPGKYAWEKLDPLIEDVRKVGGKLLLCMEGAPLWTSNKPDRRPGHVAPRDWEHLRTFAREFVQRYGKNDVLQAIEPWNEPNANLRWHDTPESLVQLHQIWFEQTRGTGLKIVGISVSPGHHVETVEDLCEAGILKSIDIVGAHFYEESYSPNRYNLRNNSPLHMDLLQIPMRRAGVVLPIWDTETGVGIEHSNGKPRPEARMPTQNEVAEALKKRKDYNPEQPWLMWGDISERRMAATWVSSTVALIAQGVEKRFSFHPNWYSLDGALILPWVTNATFGSVLQQVDFRFVMPIGINAVHGPADVGVVAYRLGKPGGKQVVVVWAERMINKNPHPGPWAPWIDPVKVELSCKEGIEVRVQDLYLRVETKVKSGDTPGGAAVTLNVGEEPVFVWDWQFRDQ